MIDHERFRSGACGLSSADLERPALPPLDRDYLSAACRAARMLAADVEDLDDLVRLAPPDGRRADDDEGGGDPRGGGAETAGVSTSGRVRVAHSRPRARARDPRTREETP